MTIPIIPSFEKIYQIIERRGDIHTATASELYKIPESEVTKAQRNYAKRFNYCILYNPDFWDYVKERKNESNYHS